MKYKIAELIVEMEPKFSPLLPQSIPYQFDSDETADCVISLSPEEYAFYKKKYKTENTSLVEYMFTGAQFYTSLISHSGILLHASAVELDGKAYLFSAPSGTGKSTHTSLWVKRFAPRAKIINDDKPAIRILPDGVYVYGTPWSGKTNLNENVKVPLQGIAFLSRGKENKITPITAKEAIPLIMEQTARPKDPRTVAKLVDLLDQLIRKIPIYRLECNIDVQAAELSYSVMKKGEVK